MVFLCNIESNTEQAITTLVMVVSLIIAILLAFLIYHWMRYRKNVAQIGDLIDKIHAERMVMRRALYADDSGATREMVEVPSWKERMHRKRAGWQDLSLFMTKSLTNDLLYISSVGRDEFEVCIEETTISKVIEILRDRLRYGASKATLEISLPEGDIPFYADVECLTIVLGHLTKFLGELSSNQHVGISVEQRCPSFLTIIMETHTSPENRGGLGVEITDIFDEFVDLQNVLQRQLGGLLMCRLIYLLICSSMRPDRNYRDGVRYLINIPSDPRRADTDNLKGTSKVTTT